MKNVSRKFFRGNVTDGGAVRLAELAAKTGQSEAWCVSLLIEEGLKALEVNGYKVPLPLKLEVAPAEEEKTSPQRPKTKAA